MEVDWLDTVTSIEYLGGMGVNWLDTVTPVVFLGGWVWGLNGLTQSLQSFIWEVCVDWLGTVTSVVYLGGMGLTGFTVTAVVYLGGMRSLAWHSHFSHSSGGYGD